MQVFTIKARPKTIFGIVLALTGVIAIVVTFLGNHSASASATAPVSCVTARERRDYIESLGYDITGKESSKTVTIPSTFNDVYDQYNAVQKQQGFDLLPYKGRTVTIYTYNITNYKDSDNVIADLMVLDGVLIGADLCDTSADDGFLVALR